MRFVPVFSLGLLSMLGCGGVLGPANSFIGSYTGSMSMTLSANGQTESDVSGGTETINQTSNDTFEIQDSGCTIECTATDSNTFNITNGACPPILTSGASCTVNLTFTEGRGTRSGTEIDFTAAGPMSMTCPPNAHP
jgi:hypothetical protein